LVQEKCRGEKVRDRRRRQQKQQQHDDDDNDGDDDDDDNNNNTLDHTSGQTVRKHEIDKLNQYIYHAGVSQNERNGDRPYDL
jgi:hypothetical protein